MENKRSSARTPSSQDLVLGTRGSELALAQTRMTEEALRQKCAINVRIEIIRTSGDKHSSDKRTEDWSRKGIFTAELERALLEHRIDVAVHSAKDLPSEMTGGLAIAAVLRRGAAEDLLITKRRLLSCFATIATGSVRRQRQTRWLKKPREIVDLHGNVPTRLRKFAGSDWDAIILARAGLQRLDFHLPHFEFEGQRFFAQILPIKQFVPAGGQGIIALQTRIGDTALLLAVDHHETHLCLRAEREFLRLLQGNCDLPVGAHARFLSGEIELSAQLFDEREKPKMAIMRGSDPEIVAAEVFRRIEQDHEHE
jgi:hydroxymethylbilane synthase